ncbi:MAG: RICIN domain-containing protein [Methylococcaceae bacterium]
MNAAARIALALGWMLAGFTAEAGVQVTQSRYDHAGTGANTQETQLNTRNVNPRQFGLLGSYPVDGDVYAQPLYVSDLAIPKKGTRNVVYLATMHDVVYAYDADATGREALIWTRDFRNPEAGIGPVPVAPLATNRNIRRYMGIESTPVIDPTTQTLYLVARTQEPADCSDNAQSDTDTHCAPLEQNRSVQTLHALDWATGEEKPGSPVIITASYRGQSFNPRFQHQRAGLVIASGQVIITWAADAVETLYPYHGWVMSYDAKTLQQTGTWATTTTHQGGGIWAAGRAPALIDNPAGGQDVILFTGNAIKTTVGYDGQNNFPESILRLRVDPHQAPDTLSLVDWFTPDNWQKLDKLDLDLGGSGPVILPGSGYIAGGGKEGILYVVDPNHMGKMQKGNPHLIQSFRAVPELHIMGGGVVWDRSTAGLPLRFYNWGESDYLKAFTFTDHRFDLSQTQSGPDYIDGHPGGILTLSANGAESGTGIVWAAGSNRGNAVRSVRQGILRAYDAADIRHLLWSSRMNTADDALAFAKFTPPTVANGKVFLATFSNQVQIYGLLPTQRARPAYVVLQPRSINKRLESAQATHFPGSRLKLASASGRAVQRFELHILPGGDRSIQSAATGLLMDDGLNPGTEPGQARLWPLREGLEAVAQAWSIEPGNPGYVRFVSRATGRALTLAKDRTTLETRPPSGLATQDWNIFRRADAGITECDTSLLQFVSALPGNPLLTADSDGHVRVQQPDPATDQTWVLGASSDEGYGFYSRLHRAWLSAPEGTTITEPDPTWSIEHLPSLTDTFSHIHSA